MEGTMFSEVPLSHEQQQEAAERILKLMQDERMTSGQAIKMVADELRAKAKKDRENASPQKDKTK